MPKLLDPFTLFGCSSNKTTISLIAIGNSNVTGKITESNECVDIGQFGHAYVVVATKAQSFLISSTFITIYSTYRN